MKMYFKYYILFYYSKNGHTGVGRRIVTLNEELDFIEGIEEIENAIKEDKKYDEVIILNWKGLK